MGRNVQDAAEGLLRMGCGLIGIVVFGALLMGCLILLAGVLSAIFGGH